MASSKPQYISIREFERPRSFALENRLLGMLIASPSYIDMARKRICDISFEDEANRNLYNSLLDLDVRGEDISMQSVYPLCNQDYFLEKIMPHIMVTPPLEAMSMINTLYNITIKRKAYNTAAQMLSLMGAASASEAVDEARKLIAEVQEFIKDEDTVSIKKATEQFAEDVEQMEKDFKAGKILRVPTSLPTLDHVTYGGWANGNLVILAARPSVGKTALALQFARCSALAGIPTLFFSLEMTNAELVQRMICSTTIMNGHDLSKGKVDWGKFEEATGKFTDLPLYFNDKASTFTDIESTIRQASRKGNCGVAIIDYLGLISFPGDTRSLREQVTDATKRLKNLAKSCGIPIVLLCQLNRDMSKEGRAPQLHDLRESGSIEQDADIVVMLDRDISGEKRDNHDLSLYLRKNRQGSIPECLHLKADDWITNFTEKEQAIEYEAPREMPKNLFGKDEDDENEFERD